MLSDEELKNISSEIKKYDKEIKDINLKRNVLVKKYNNHFKVKKKEERKIKNLIEKQNLKRKRDEYEKKESEFEGNLKNFLELTENMFENISKLNNQLEEINVKTKGHSSSCDCNYCKNIIDTKKEIKNLEKKLKPFQDDFASLCIHINERGEIFDNIILRGDNICSTCNPEYSKCVYCGTFHSQSKKYYCKYC